MSWIIGNTLIATGLAAIVWVVCRLTRPRPALAHLLWLLVILHLVCPPLWRWSVAVPQLTDRATASLGLIADDLTDDRATAAPPNAIFAAEVADPITATSPSSAETTRAPVRDVDEETGRAVQPTAVAEVADGPGVLATVVALPWSEILFWAWCIGSGLVLCITSIGIHRVHRRVKRGNVAPSWLSKDVRDLALQLGVEAPPIRVVSALTSAFVWSVGRPTLVWPTSWLDQRDSRRARSVLAHELAHVRRKDHWTARLEFLATVALWWHPLLWFARTRMRACAELACDAWAVWAEPLGRHAYASALVDAIELESHAVTAMPALGAWHGGRRAFEERLLMILHQNVPCRLSRWTVAPLAALALTVASGVSFAQDESRRGDENRVEQRVEQRIEERVLRLVNEHLRKQLGEDFRAKDLDSIAGAIDLAVQKQTANTQDPRRRGSSEDLREIIRQEVRRELARMRGERVRDDAAEQDPPRRTERRTRSGRTVDLGKLMESSLVQDALRQAKREINSDPDIRKIGIADDIEDLIGALLGEGGQGDGERFGSALRSIIDKGLDYGLGEAKREMKKEGIDGGEFVDAIGGMLRGAMLSEDGGAMQGALGKLIRSALDQGLAEARSELKAEGFDNVEFLDHISPLIEASLSGKDRAAGKHLGGLQSSLGDFIGQAIDRGLAEARAEVGNDPDARAMIDQIEQLIDDLLEGKTDLDLEGLEEHIQGLVERAMKEGKGRTLRRR